METILAKLWLILRDRGKDLPTALNEGGRLASTLRILDLLIGIRIINLIGGILSA